MSNIASEIKKVFSYLSSLSSFVGTILGLLEDIQNFRENGQFLIALLSPVFYEIGILELCSICSFLAIVSILGGLVVGLLAPLMENFGEIIADFIGLNWSTLKDVKPDELAGGSISPLQ